MDALLQWGKERDYPALWCPPYAIGPGEYCWTIAVGLGKEDFLQAMLVAIQSVMQTEIPGVSTPVAM